jgi:hypothetical protein
MKVKAATLMPFLLLLPTFLLAQGPCPTKFSTPQENPPRPALNLTLSHDLICTIPQVYGPGGLVGVANNGPLGSTDQSSAAFKHSVHFQDASLASFAPLTAKIGTELSLLPFTSPASGFIFRFNPSLQVYTRSAENFGPILTERADTIGKHKLFVGISYQFFDFDKADGVNLRNFKAVFQHEHENCPSPYDPTTVTCINNGAGPPQITRDFVSTQNRIDLKVHQGTVVSTFGVTDQFDVSIAVPVLHISMDMTSAATINNFEATDSTIRPACCVHQFAPPPVVIPGETLGPQVTASSNGFMYYNSASFFRANSASGIGDIVFRGKYQVFKGEKAGVAVGGDLRIPTGDELNFLGSGTWGIRPFGVFTYSGRFSPRASLGYQVNGNSVLGGDISSYTAERLPDVLTYSAGADYGISTRLSLSADFLGQTLRNAKKIATTATTTLMADNSTVPFPGLVTSTGTSNLASVAVGGKFNPFGKLLVTANILIRVNDAGLHSKPVPLGGLSYTF